ncbi:MAG: transposase [Patescibacteria group bacterium]|nr:transposase [Patescibacteria group bacterium]
MRRAYKFRLFTNANQERELGIMLESHRRLYNTCLDQRKTTYQTEQRSVKYTEQSARFKEQRSINPYFARLNFSSAQATMRRLDRAYQAFFRRVKAGDKPGYPRFKGRNRFDSIEFPAYGDGIRLNGNRLRVQHIGMIRVKVHRVVEGKIKTVTLKREADKWYVILSCDLGDVPVQPSTNPPIGIDMGLESFLTTSEGQSFPNPRYLKKELPKLRVTGRAVARKKKGGSNRRKAVRKLQRIHARVRNLRREHHHQTTLALILTYGLIALESLNIRGMLRNGRLARAIADAAWGGFVNILKGKAESAGVRIVEVDPRGTSQQCSACGREVRKDLSVRWHDCPYCNLSLHRDHNAALNILARVRLVRTEPVGGNVGQQVMRLPRSRYVHVTE